MKYTSFVRAALLCSALSLVPVYGYATSGGEGNNTGCNGRGNPNSPCEGTPGAGGQGGTGGQGGSGGAGGRGGNAAAGAVAVGVGVGVGGQGGHGGNATAAGGNARARGGSATAAGGNGTGGNATVTVQNGGAGGNGSQSGTYRVANVPDAYAPPIGGGANPCTVGVSLGGSLVGGGASAGITWNDDDCEARVRSILLHNYGRDRNDPRLLDASVELLCEHRATRRAMQRAGTPCMADRPVAAAPAPEPQMTSVRATTVQPQVVLPTGCPAGQYPLPAPYQHVCR